MRKLEAVESPAVQSEQQKERECTKEYDDLWCTKELVWEKVYKVYAQSKIINVSYYDIKGKAL